jgi:hypothetical protein
MKQIQFEPDERHPFKDDKDLPHNQKPWHCPTCGKNMREEIQEATQQEPLMKVLRCWCGFTYAISLSPIKKDIIDKCIRDALMDLAKKS